MIANSISPRSLLTKHSDFGNNAEGNSKQAGIKDLLRAQMEEKRLLEMQAKLKDQNYYQMNMEKSKFEAS